MPKYSLLNQDINTSFLNIETTWAGMRSPLLKGLVGKNIPPSFCELIKGETLNYYQDEKLAKSFSRNCAGHLISDHTLLLLIKQKTRKLANQILLLSKNNFPLSALSDRQLISFLEKSRFLQGQLATWGMPVAFADVYGQISESIFEIFTHRQNLRRPLNFYLDILSNPEKPSLSALAYAEIASSRDNEYLKKKYFWLDQGYIGRGITLKHIQEIKKHQISGHVPAVSRKDLLKELNLSPLEKKLLSVSADMVEIKSIRADVRQAFHVVTNNIVDRLASRWRIPAKFLEVLSTEELILAIKNKGVTLEGLDSRWERSLIIPTSLNRYRILLEKDIDTFLSSRGIISRKIVKENLELKGQVAQMGKARGKVRLVFGPQHNNKVKKGDILVSISTSPQLLPAMKIASAFVTEVGGITSHAAIVARELRRPCIVGVKGSTQLLSDGDLVEVDADKGVVRIIK